MRLPHTKGARRLGATLLLAGMLAACGSEPAPATPDRYIVPGDRVFPGGIAYHEPTAEYFVGSTRDGTVFRGRLDNPEATPWLPGGSGGRTTTSGLAADGNGRLFIGGGPTARLWIHDIATGELLAELPGVAGGFVNDVALAEDGSAYVTDSMANVIYRVTEHSGGWEMRPWLNLADTPVPRVDGHNLNGIVAAGRDALLTVHSMTGGLYRIDRNTQEVTELHTGGTRAYGGDGLVLDADTLYVVQGGLSPLNPRPQVSVLRLAPDLAAAEQVCARTDPGFRHPSTARLAGDRLLVVNSQYNTGLRDETPELPFTVSALDTTAGCTG
ncbi:hypothetical protein IU433_01790 [Nocardia puris]|uniref:hypothetical protein n=1 Tax=Nocardia puris TaxID=208602 RepID=UPI001892DA72|nr:hypothetical protein [Nocardia puris]MBF6210518.1 hypothetical protein [Nocardia puris]MBF6369243.1 hypothetical protein [Nocardia puris]MBF6457778.1 hypothetical protein [Nocardia puris]